MYRFLLFFLNLFLSFSSAYALDSEGINRIENYLNSISSLQASFTQIKDGEKEKSGYFYLSKPGKLKWEYLRPKKILLIAKGNKVLYYNYELEEISHLSSNSALLSFLAKPKIDLTKDVEIINYKATPSQITIELIPPKSEKDSNTNISKMDINFTNSQPLTIKSLTVWDLNSELTTISFDNVETNIDIPSKTFDFQNPNFFKK